VSRASAAAVAAAAAFAALAGLVAAGALTSIDQWAIDHAAPGVHLTGTKPTFVQAVVPLWGAWWHSPLAVVTNIVTLPASFTIATLIVATACVKLGGRRGLVLAAAYVAGNVVEVVTKDTLTRPALYAHGVHLAAFDDSFPSGHTVRSVLVAFAVAWAWPRFARWAVVWAIASIALVEADAWHVPSDVAGGLLLAALLAATAWSSAPGARPTACRPSSRAR
jgi:membrane-associated phospholipid phosphatase